MTDVEAFDKVWHYVTYTLRYRVRHVDFRKVSWGRTAQGCIDQPKRLVCIDECLITKPREAFYTLLHEAGHILSYKLRFNTLGWKSTYKVKDSLGRSYIRSHNPRSLGRIANETQAYLLGTALAAKLGIKLNMRAWKKFNWEARL